MTRSSVPPRRNRLPGGHRFHDDDVDGTPPNGPVDQLAEGENRQAGLAACGWPISEHYMDFPRCGCDHEEDPNV